MEGDDVGGREEHPARVIESIFTTGVQPRQLEEDRKQVAVQFHDGDDVAIRRPSEVADRLCQRDLGV
jgi:argininosuccinate synthase